MDSLPRSRQAGGATLYLSTTWYVSRGSEGDPTPAQVRGLKAQLTRGFADMPKFAVASNTDKQNLADMLILEALFNGADHRRAR